MTHGGDAGQARSIAMRPPVLNRSANDRNVWTFNHDYLISSLFFPIFIPCDQLLVLARFSSSYLG